MEYTNSDVYAYQLLHHLVVKEHYQIINIQKQKQDFWLMNAKNEDFPVIRICNDTNEEVLNSIEYMRNVQRAILDIMKREGKVCVFNTLEDSTPYDNEYMAQYKFVPQVKRDSHILRVFKDIYHCIHDVEDLQKECADLMRNLEANQMKKAKARQKAFKVTMPKVTTAIILICLIYYLVIQFFSSAMGNPLGGIVATGVYYKMNVIGLHEYWRLFTTGFMHLSIFHFFINMYALFNIGMLCEKLYKRSFYIIILLASMVIGNIFVFIAEGNVLTLGISGGIYGLMGAYIVSLFENGQIKQLMARASIMRILMINLMISFLPEASWLAHLGGLFTGVFLGLLFIPSKRWVFFKKHVAASIGMFVVFLGYIAWQVDRVVPLDKESDKIIIESYRKLEWNAYADYTQECYENIYKKEELK